MKRDAVGIGMTILFVLIVLAVVPVCLLAVGMGA